MSIPSEHRSRYVYHMTHLENLESILQNELLSTNEKTRLGIKHKNIANHGIQNRRAAMNVTCGPMGTVHDYVPFYFSPSVPMLLGLLNSKNLDQQLIIYLAVKIDVVEREDVVFTSASANTNISPTFYCRPEELANLRWDLIDSYKWSLPSDDDRHAKMAEMLIHEKVEMSEIGFIVVWNKYFKKNANNLLAKANCQIEIKYGDYQLASRNIHHYFHPFFSKGKERQSLVTGPEMLKSQYQEVVRIIKKQHQDTVPNPKFENVSDSIDKISEDFSVIPELDAIEELETANAQHWQSVGDHTKRVVEKLKQLEEYSTFSNSQKKVLKLSAYLHDIGKGTSPKDNDGKQKTDKDHPVSAIPMLERILSEDIESISNRKIRQTVMLVIYHDLIGDVIGNDRDREQILNVIRTIEDFDMLVAISKADVSSLISGKRWKDHFSGVPQWLKDINNKVPELRSWVESKLEEAE